MAPITLVRPDSAPAQVPGAPLRILVIDDQEDDALLLQIQLRDVIGEARFTRIEDEAHLVASLADATWDLIICDHHMPGFDSRRALEIVQQTAPGTPFVIYSGQFDPERALAAMRAGANDFVDKRDTARLVPVIERELRHARLRREKAHADSSVLQLANFDALTRLPNRASFSAALDAQFASGTTGERPALVVFDIDRFRRVNESYGLATGDALLRAVGEVLAEMIGRRTFLSRLSHDVFAVLLPGNATEHTAQAFAQRLARRFAEGFTVQGAEYHFTLSMGIAFYPHHGADAATLIRNAESARYGAKNHGGNQIKRYESAMNAQAERRLTLESALHHAVGRNELKLAWQPIMLTGSNRIVGAEALLRWQHPSLGLVMPDEFIAVAEETGQIASLGDYALKQACSEMRALHDRGLGRLRASVNVAAAQFREPGLTERVLDVLAETGLPPSALELEITESAAMESAGHTVRTLESLRAAGISVALDDFGMGFSSLGYLKRFPIDVLKVDRAFIAGLPGSREDAAIVSALSALAHGLNITLHAEGVETVAQRDWLLLRGCHRIQGYLIGRPGTPAALLAAATNRAPSEATRVSAKLAVI
jgi:diguanylate cyclase